MLFQVVAVLGLALTLGCGGETAGGRTAGDSGGGSGVTGGASSGGHSNAGSAGFSGGPSLGGAAALGGRSAGGATAAGGNAGTSGGAAGTTGGASTEGGMGGAGEGGTGEGGLPNAAGMTGSGGAAAGMGGGAGGSPPTCTATTLKQAGACTERLIGTALSTQHFAEVGYLTNALEFNYVTPENEMKWLRTEPTQNQFTYGDADEIVAFAEENGMKVKGHTLVWYNQLPGWVESITDESELRAAMTHHIQQVMTHYQGQVIAWDVVNEAIDDDDPTMLRDSVFTRVLGPAYIDEAFQIARATDPSVKLYYNDYSTDGLGDKADAVYELVKSMKERDIPIDGVGLQMHTRAVAPLTAADVSANIERLGALGLEVVISEMDAHLCRGGTLEDQQARFHDIVQACVTEPACKAISFWGITDKHSWLNGLDVGCTGSDRPRALLWDDSYAKKPAYTGVLDALLGR